jgi:hypothetical protein
MTHEIPDEPGPTKIRFTDRIGGTTHRASVRTSLLEPGLLVWVQRQKVQYLDLEDATALRDFLTDWLRKERRRTQPPGGSS